MIPREFGIYFLMFCVSLGFNFLSVEMSVAERWSYSEIQAYMFPLDNSVFFFSS